MGFRTMGTIIFSMALFLVFVLLSLLLLIVTIRSKDFRRWMLSPATPGSWFRIILWWEIRRIPYNIIMSFCGFAGVFFLLFLISMTEPKGDIEFIVIPLVGIAANMFYTGGWITEIIIRFLWKEKAAYFGPIMWTLGTAFSMCVCFLPGLLQLAWWLARVAGLSNA